MELQFQKKFEKEIDINFKTDDIDNDTLVDVYVKNPDNGKWWKCQSFNK